MLCSGIIYGLGETKTIDFVRIIRHLLGYGIINLRRYLQYRIDQIRS